MTDDASGSSPEDDEEEDDDIDDEIDDRGAPWMPPPPTRCALCREGASVCWACWKSAGRRDCVLVGLLGVAVGAGVVGPIVRDIASSDNRLNALLAYGISGALIASVIFAFILVARWWYR